VELEEFEKQRDVTEPMNETDTYIYLGLVPSTQIQKLRLRGKYNCKGLCVCVCVCVRAHWLCYFYHIRIAVVDKHARTHPKNRTGLSLSHEEAKVTCDFAGVLCKRHLNQNIRIEGVGNLRKIQHASSKNQCCSHVR